MFLLILETEEEGEREKHWFERETLISCLPTCTLTGDRACNLGMCPDQESDPQPFCCTRWCSKQLSHLARARWQPVFKWPHYCPIKNTISIPNSSMFQASHPNHVSLPPCKHHTEESMATKLSRSLQGKGPTVLWAVSEPQSQHGTAW